MPNLQQSTRGDYFRSVWSLLTTIPFTDRDQFYKDIMGKRTNFSDDGDLKLYTKTITRDGQSFDVPWIQAGHGFYTIVERNIPFIHKGLPRYHEGISVLYSDKPKSLKAVLSGDTSRTEDIDILSFQKKKDFEILGKISYRRLINRIKEDNQTLRVDIQSHETFIGESDRLWRSDSCVLFALPHPNEPDHHDIYQYFNPLGEDGLFINDDMLDNSKYQKYLKSISLKTTPHPVAKSHLTKWMHERANFTAKQTMNGFSPDKPYNSFKNLNKKIFKGASQPIFHTLARLNIPSAITGTVIAGVSAYAFVFVATLFAAAKTMGMASLLTKTAVSSLVLGTNPISRVLNGIVKYVPRLIHRNKTRQVKRFYDYKVDFTPYPHFITDIIRATKAKPAFFDGIKFMPSADFSSFFGNNVAPIPTHGEKEEMQWFLSKKIHADCHKGASVISLLFNTKTNATALQLIDGRGDRFIHEIDGEACAVEQGKAIKITLDGNGDYIETEICTSVLDFYQPLDYRPPKLTPFDEQPIANDQTLSILPDSRTKRKAVSARNALNTAGSMKSISPRPSGLVVHGARARKL